MKIKFKKKLSDTKELEHSGRCGNMIERNYEFVEDIKQEARKELLEGVKKMIDKKIKHSGWVSKDLLYDNLKVKECDEEICVIDLAELKQQLEKLGEK